MFSFTNFLAVVSAAIVATAQSLHLTSYFPQDVCIQRSSLDLLYSLPPAALLSTVEAHLTIVTDLDRVVEETYDAMRITEAEIFQRRAVLSDLEHDLSGRNLSLEAFGSCCNGFGTVASDLDVKITGNITQSEIVQL